MSQNKITTLLGVTLTALLFSAGLFASNLPGNDDLTLGKETTFVLKNKGEKTLYLNLKKGEFAQISYADSLDRFPDYALFSPSGRDILKDAYITESTPLIAPEEGRYRLSVKLDETETDITEAKITVGYTNVFKLPPAAKLARQRKIGGYDIKVYNNPEETASYLLIEKNGKLQQILKGGSLVAGGFNFADDHSLFEFAEGKKSARLMRNTVDKTGDGSPDVAVQFYTGGAHCCIDLHFFELGDNGVRKLKTIGGRDSDVLAIGKKSGGSLLLKTGDSNFAYWLTSFAGSPIPKVILSYRNGEFRPDLESMRKPAPSLVALKQKAAKAKRFMDTKPYVDEESGDFQFRDAFWGEMLDLMYAGNETAAWQYFDLVWDARKPGKEKFKQDFIEQLNKSEFWQMMIADSK